ncbi:MAG TPA: hypothetical protein VEJ63_04720 [Planctomycetota bacterium]|nr:hypothetical protein [Planctomycetota bacterium]
MSITLGAVVTPLPGQERWFLAGAKRAGFSAVQINLTQSPRAETVSACIDACAEEGLEIGAWGVYGNPLQPHAMVSDEQGVRSGVTAQDIGALLQLLPPRREDEGPWMIVSLSGTLSGAPGTPHPGNQSPGALAELGRWTEQQYLALESRNAVLAFKNHYAHVLSEANRIKGFFAPRANPSIGVALDPCALLTPKNFGERENLMTEAIKTLAPYTALVHIKDARIENFRIDIAGPGQGQIGMAGLLKQLWRYARDVVWLVDAVENELQLKRSREYLELQAKLAGIV